MTTKPARRILVTNDDGINAEGLTVLETIAEALTGEVWVVAPEYEQSGASRSLSLSNPMRLRQLGERRFAVSGTPADCVLMATRQIMPAAPDIVLSGVNSGQNVADDVTYSGTIAAAMEGAALGITSLALSQSYGIDNARIDYGCALGHGEAVVRHLLKDGLPAGSLININFPDCAADEVAGIAVTRQGRRDQSMIRVDARIDARGRDYFWLGFTRERSNPPQGTDLHAIYSRQISITPLQMDLTRTDLLDDLQSAVAGAASAVVDGED